MPAIRVNDHDMYYEIHGDGDPLVCIGGWGTYCHGRTGNLSRGLTDSYRVLIIDYRGIGESTDDISVEPTMELHANDVIGLLDHLEWSNVHFVGLVGMGACISQHVALKRPDLVRSMVNMGCWMEMDPFLQDQLELFLTMHRDGGFLEFQRFCSMMSFLPDYYNTNRERLLGAEGVWCELNGRYAAHERLVKACISHDVVSQMSAVSAPTLVIHAGQDYVTGPRTTLPIEHAIPGAEGFLMEDAGHIVAGKAQKIAFCNALFGFLEKH